jgi:indole-3-glycerol phosphate synthase
MQGPSLATILDAARSRAASLAPRRAVLARRAAEAGPVASFRAALVGGAVAVVAEVKRRSPSAGELRSDLDAAGRARAYVAGGARAVSVLTDEPFFGGSMGDLAAVAAAVRVPLLCKDFIVDPLQVLEARGAGASAVLLIVRALAAEQLRELAATARGVGLETVIEAHTDHEVDRALEAGAGVVGVNSRDLDSFSVDLAVAERLLARVPPGVPALAESGVRGVAEVERLARAGADAVLVGTTLSRSVDGEAAVRALSRVPRQGRAAARDEP